MAVQYDPVSNCLKSILPKTITRFLLSSAKSGFFFSQTGKGATTLILIIRTGLSALLQRIKALAERPGNGSFDVEVNCSFLATTRQQKTAISSRGLFAALFPNTCLALRPFQILKLVRSPFPGSVR